MEPLQDLFGNQPRTVFVLLVLAISSLIVWWSSQSFRMTATGVNEGFFKARPLLLLFFGGMCAVLLWPVVTGLGDPSPISDGLDLFLILNVLPRLLFFGMAAFFGLAIFILQRSYIRVTPEVVEYADGWHKVRRIARNDIVSAVVRYPAILVVQCQEEEDNFSIQLLAYSQSGFLAALLERSAMRI